MSRNPAVEFVALQQHEALAKRVEALEANLQKLAEVEAVEALVTAPALTERVVALEASVGELRVTRIDASGSALSARENIRACLADADSPPAWQRAKVGDRVEMEADDGWHATGTVVRVNEEYAPPWSCRLFVQPDGLGNAVWVNNAFILSILPPEPERPKDEPETNGAAVKESLTTQAALSPESLDALKAEAAGFTPTEAAHRRLCSLLDRVYALGLSERVQPVAEDVRERAIEAIGDMTAHTVHIVDALASAGLLASQPKASKYRAQLAGLKWSVCESEVLRDPAVKGAARDILTELANIVIEGE